MFCCFIFQQKNWNKIFERFSQKSPQCSWCAPSRTMPYEIIDDGFGYIPVHLAILYMNRCCDNKTLEGGNALDSGSCINFTFE